MGIQAQIVTDIVRQGSQHGRCVLRQWHVFGREGLFHEDEVLQHDLGCYCRELVIGVLQVQPSIWPFEKIIYCGQLSYGIRYRLTVLGGFRISTAII